MSCVVKKGLCSTVSLAGGPHLALNKEQALAGQEVGVPSAV